MSFSNKATECQEGIFGVNIWSSELNRCGSSAAPAGVFYAANINSFLRAWAAQEHTVRPQDWAVELLHAPGVATKTRQEWLAEGR